MKVEHSPYCRARWAVPVALFLTAALLALLPSCSILVPEATQTPAIIYMTVVATATPRPLPTPLPTEVPVQEVAACSLLAKGEAELILGQPVDEPEEANGACTFATAGDRLYIVSAAAAQGSATAGILQGQAFLLGMAGAPLDQATLDRLQALAAAQDYQAYFDELVRLSENAPAARAEIVSGVGDAAYWLWLAAGTRRQGAFVLADGSTLVNINTVVADTQAQQTVMNASRALAAAVLARLPARFTIAGQTMTGPTPTIVAVVSTDTPAGPAVTDTPPPPTETPTAAIPPTDTPIPPTHTPVPPTRTPVPPSRTPTPTATRTPTPTPPPDLTWTEVAGQGVTDVRVAAVTFSHTLFLFSKGIGDKRIYINSTADGAAWTGTRPLPGNGTTNAAMWATAFANRLYLFGQGSDDQRIYVDSTADGANWSNWSEVPGGGMTDVPLTASTIGGRLCVFAKAIADQHIYMNSTGDGTHWTGWSEVPGAGLTDTSPAASTYDDTLYLFVRGIDNRAYVNKTNDGAGWSGWKKVPGAALTDIAMVAVAMNDGLYLFSRGIDDRRIYLNYSADGVNWTGAARVPGDRTSSTGPAASALKGKLYLFVKGTDNRIYMMPGVEQLK